MKKVFISYANDVKDLTILLEFFNVIHKLKFPMMEDLPFINDKKDFNIVTTLFDDIVGEVKFSTEIIRIYNNILAIKLDNDQSIDLMKCDDIDINKLNTNNLTQSTRKSRKRKCNNKESDFSNIQQTYIIKSAFKKFKIQSKNKYFISRFNKKKIITKNINNDKNTKTNDDITHER